MPKDRALSPLEIWLFVQQMESVATYPTIKLALRLILLRGLKDDLYDVGFCQSNDVGDHIVVEPIWRDPLALAVQVRHPLLT